MAEAKQEEKAAEKKEVAETKKDERIFTIPLRKAFRTERTRMGKKAMLVIREFLERHMKGEVKIGKSINESVWARGIQKPPRRVRVHATKEGSAVYAELVGEELKKPSAEEAKKKEEKEKAKEEKIKKERKERKGKTLQEEIKEEKEASKGIAPAAETEEKKEKAK